MIKRESQVYYNIIKNRILLWNKKCLHQTIKIRIMKNLSLVMALMMSLFLSSCRDIANAVLDVLPPFEVPFSTSMQVPFASVSTTSYTRTPEIPMNIDLDAQIKSQNSIYSINNLKSVKMSFLTVAYETSQLGNKLDVIKNANIYIKAPNLPEKLIATAYNNTNPTVINFTSTDAEMLDYFKTNQNSLIVEIQGNSVTADRITMKMDSKFKVRVQL